MSNPCQGDTNWIPGTSGWREGVTTLPLTCLVPVPGCFLGSEPATCPLATLAGRKFTPAATFATGRKSSAGPETPPLTLLVPRDPVPYPCPTTNYPGSNWWTFAQAGGHQHHLNCEHRAGSTHAQCNTDTARDEEPRQTRAGAAAAKQATRRAHADDDDPRPELEGWTEFGKNEKSDSTTSRNPMFPSLCGLRLQAPSTPFIPSSRSRLLFAKASTPTSVVAAATDAGTLRQLRLIYLIHFNDPLAFTSRHRDCLGSKKRTRPFLAENSISKFRIHEKWPHRTLQSHVGQQHQPEKTRQDWRQRPWKK